MDPSTESMGLLFTFKRESGATITGRIAIA
jgi:hypothetical protein